jgi:hypothetical protein
MEDRVRVIRILVYEGGRAWVEQALSRAMVPPQGEKYFGRNVIQSAVLGTFPEILERSEQNASEHGNSDPSAKTE